jgi:hypothetical protein
VYQGRYAAVIVEREAHLLGVARYVVMNPVRAGRAAAPKHWPWSSYRATAGLTSPETWLNVGRLLGWFGVSLSEDEARRRYRAFVDGGAQDPSPWTMLRGRIFLGGDEFIKRWEDLVSRRADDREIPRDERFVNRPGLRELLGETGSACDTEERRSAVHRALFAFGYTQEAIARWLKVHPATVSRMIRRRNGDEKL